MFHRRRELLDHIPYLCCLIFVVYEVVAFGLRAVYFVCSPAGPTTEGCQLDSFSKPSVASAILREEAQRLTALYTLHRPAGIAAAHQREMRSEDNQIIQRLEELQDEVCATEAELDSEIMIVYFDNHRYKEFLDCYLHFVHSNPQSANVLTWAWPAASCASHCNRTMELYSELENLARFHPELKTAPGLTNLLAEWRPAGKSCASAPIPLRKPELGCPSTH